MTDDIGTTAGPSVLPHPFDRDGLASRITPFVAVAVLGMATIAIPPHPSAEAVGASAALLGIVVSSIAMLPWRRLPSWAAAIPPLVFIVAVALLRYGQGGAVSGFASLHLLPVVWFALHGRRMEVAVAVGAVAVAVTAPLMIAGDAGYPTSELRRAFVLTAVAALVGHVVFRTMGLARSQTDEVTRVQRASAALAAPLQPDEVLQVLLGAATAVGSDTAGSRRAQLFRIRGDEAELAVEFDARGQRSAGLVFPLDSHPHLPTVVRTLATCLGPLDADKIAAPLGPAIAAVGVTHGVYVPLIVDGELFGVVGVASRGAPPTTATTRRIETLVSIGSIALSSSLARQRLIADNVTLLDAAETDALTGLANRRAWDRALTSLDERPDTMGSVDIGVIDLDHFKQYNDTHGHVAGDELLRGSARNWAGVMRRHDVLARIGGEEFGFIVVDAPDDVALELAQRLRTSTAAPSTCSVGLARRRTGEPLAEALARADAALYEAKAAGRNRVVVAE